MVFLKIFLVPPGNKGPRFFREGNIVEGKRHVERVQGRSKFFREASFPELFRILPVLWAVDTTEVLFPELIPRTFYVCCGTDAGAALPNPKIGGDNVALGWETIGSG